MKNLRIILNAFHEMLPKDRKAVFGLIKETYCHDCGLDSQPCECFRPTQAKCENCGESDPSGAHWGDDGPNRSGWTCPRQTLSIHDEFKAAVKKLKSGVKQKR